MEHVYVDKRYTLQINIIVRDAVKEARHTFKLTVILN